MRTCRSRALRALRARRRVEGCRAETARRRLRSSSWQLRGTRDDERRCPARNAVGGVWGAVVDGVCFARAHTSSRSLSPRPSPSEALAARRRPRGCCCSRRRPGPPCCRSLLSLLLCFASPPRPITRPALLRRSAWSVPAAQFIPAAVAACAHVGYRICFCGQVLALLLFRRTCLGGGERSLITEHPAPTARQCSYDNNFLCSYIISTTRDALSISMYSCIFSFSTSALHELCHGTSRVGSNPTASVSSTYVC